MPSSRFRPMAASRLSPLRHSLEKRHPARRCRLPLILQAQAGRRIIAADCSDRGLCRSWPHVAHEAGGSNGHGRHRKDPASFLVGYFLMAETPRSPPRSRRPCGFQAAWDCPRGARRRAST